jgi:hypothetical protein
MSVTTLNDSFFNWAKPKFKPDVNVVKLLFYVTLTLRQNKLECLSLASFFSLFDIDGEAKKLVFIPGKFYS